MATTEEHVSMIDTAGPESDDEDTQLSAIEFEPPTSKVPQDAKGAASPAGQETSTGTKLDSAKKRKRDEKDNASSGSSSSSSLSQESDSSSSSAVKRSAKKKKVKAASSSSNDASDAESDASSSRESAVVRRSRKKPVKKVEEEKEDNASDGDDESSSDVVVKSRKKKKDKKMVTKGDADANSDSSSDDNKASSSSGSSASGGRRRRRRGRGDDRPAARSSAALAGIEADASESGASSGSSSGAEEDEEEAYARRVRKELAREAARERGDEEDGDDDVEGLINDDEESVDSDAEREAYNKHREALDNGEVALPRKTTVDSSCATLSGINSFVSLPKRANAPRKSLADIVAKVRRRVNTLATAEGPIPDDASSSGDDDAIQGIDDADGEVKEEGEKNASADKDTLPNRPRLSRPSSLKIGGGFLSKPRGADSHGDDDDDDMMIELEFEDDDEGETVATTSNAAMAVRSSTPTIGGSRAMKPPLPRAPSRTGNPSAPRAPMTRGDSFHQPIEDSQDLGDLPTTSTTREDESAPPSARRPRNPLMSPPTLTASSGDAFKFTAGQKSASLLVTGDATTDATGPSPQPPKTLLGLRLDESQSMFSDSDSQLMSPAPILDRSSSAASHAGAGDDNDNATVLDPALSGLTQSAGEKEEDGETGQEDAAPVKRVVTYGRKNKAKNDDGVKTTVPTLSAPPLSTTTEAVPAVKEDATSATTDTKTSDVETSKEVTAAKPDETRAAVETDGRTPRAASPAPSSASSSDSALQELAATLPLTQTESLLADEADEVANGEEEEGGPQAELIEATKDGHDSAARSSSEPGRRRLSSTRTRSASVMSESSMCALASKIKGRTSAQERQDELLRHAEIQSAKEAKEEEQAAQRRRKRDLLTQQDLMSPMTHNVLNDEDSLLLNKISKKKNMRKRERPQSAKTSAQQVQVSPVKRIRPRHGKIMRRQGSLLARANEDSMSLTSLHKAATSMSKAFVFNSQAAGNSNSAFSLGAGGVDDDDTHMSTSVPKYKPSKAAPARSGDFTFRNEKITKSKKPSKLMKHLTSRAAASTPVQDA